jgi:AraC-like DNA-binding protein
VACRANLADCGDTRAYGLYQKSSRVMLAAPKSDRPLADRSLADRSLAHRFSVSHRGLAKGRAYDGWREEICRGFCRLEIGPAEDDFIDCRNEIVTLNTVAIATPSGSSARFARTRDLLDDGCDDLVLLSATHGRIRVTQGGKTIDLAAGEMCLTEMNIAGAVDLNRTGGFTTTRFSRRRLLAAAPAAETRLAQVLGRDRGLGTMIMRYIALCNEVAGELDALGQEAAGRHLTDLVGQFIGAGAVALEPEGLAAARLDLLKAGVLRNLGRSDLTIEKIARANGISGRQAQRMFAAAGSTYTAFVLEQRLLLAHRLLSQAAARQCKISDIAFTAGFNDLSYFHRAFKRRFAATPAEVQAERSA